MGRHAAMTKPHWWLAGVVDCSGGSFSAWRCLAARLPPPRLSAQSADTQLVQSLLRGALFGAASFTLHSA